MELQIEYLALDELTPYEQNARRHEDQDVDAIVSSIREFGFDDPIGVWGDENIIVEGHGRLLAARKLGMDTVPVIRLDHLSDEQRRAYALAHNKTAELSEWNWATLDSELLKIGTIDMSQFGFDIIVAGSDAEIIEDNYRPEIPDEPKSKRGDVYILGDHRLMCGDSTSTDDIEKLMGGV